MLGNARKSDVASFVPHEGDAILMDAVWKNGEDTTKGVATVRAGTPFDTNSDGLPSWMIIELMAQVVAASAGLREFRPGVRPRLGLLLAVRSMNCSCELLPIGARLEIEARESTRDDAGMGVFDCMLHTDGVLTATAILSVYLPKNAEAYLLSLES
jgi:predicted hotdog family 3-hydroxylacyl-ACP dehydratase